MVWFFCIFPRQLIIVCGYTYLTIITFILVFLYNSLFTTTTCTLYVCILFYLHILKIIIPVPFLPYYSPFTAIILYSSFSCPTEQCTSLSGMLGWDMNMQDSNSGWAQSQFMHPKLQFSLLERILIRSVFPKKLGFELDRSSWHLACCKRWLNESFSQMRQQKPKSYLLQVWHDKYPSQLK